jgi:nucleoside-diphosphate-sugar epimerase
MGGSWEDFERGTIAGTRNVVEACLALAVPKLVYVSSLSVIDWAGADGGPPVTESAALEPQPELRGFYTQSKLAAERLVSEAVAARGLAAVIVRPGQIFGPGAPIEGATGALHVGRRLIVLGDGASRLPLVHVDDVVDSLLLAATRGAADGSIYQLVDDTPVTQRALTEQVAAATGLHAVFVPQPLVLVLTQCIELLGRLLRRSVPLTRYRLRSAQARLTFDSSKAKRELGWAPRTGVIAGLRGLLDRSHAT